MYFHKLVELCFLQVFRSSNYAYIGKSGCRLQLCHRVWAVFLLCQDVVMSITTILVMNIILDEKYMQGWGPSLAFAALMDQ